jgi:hypothetical protein
MEHLVLPIGVSSLHVIFRNLAPPSTLFSCFPTLNLLLLLLILLLLLLLLLQLLLLLLLVSSSSSFLANLFLSVSNRWLVTLFNLLFLFTVFFLRVLFCFFLPYYSLFYWIYFFLLSP